MNQENREQPMEEGQEEIPVEPVQDEVQVQEVNVNINPPQPQQQEEPRHPPIEELQPFDEPRGPSQAEELSMVHRKINRVLGRTDELQSIKNRVNSTFTLLNVVDQRTTKAGLNLTLNGLEQVYEQQKGLMEELQDHMEVLKDIRELATPPPPPR
ncbi:unnamed protein product [Haemonchus placei]|uniref:Biogenesis of lysosome-related organelles complex 1 subunit 7 n=1 Tax=Haemonchus placei TaxID=6290 RepID=A0A0N4WLR5_HAEPC|nr:unnamed protein product [Haemonchus placei]